MSPNDVVNADGLGIFENLFGSGSPHGERRDFASGRFFVEQGGFDRKFVVRAHHHLDGRKVNPVAVHDDFGVGVGDLFDEDNDVGHDGSLHFHRQPPACN